MATLKQPFMVASKKGIPKSLLEAIMDRPDDFVKDMIKETPIEVTTDNLIDGGKIVTQMSLSQLHILEDNMI